MDMPYHDTFYYGRFYHIFNRSINNEVAFRTKRNYMFFLERWGKYIGDLLEVYAYCLLPTHFHFFARVSESFTKLEKFRKALSDFSDVNALLENQFMLLFRSYALAFNKENNRSGGLFQKSFKRIRIDTEKYFTTVIHYIHNNPIHHHYQDSYEKWPFSSYNAYLSNSPTKVRREDVLDWFGSKSAFVEFHAENIKYDKVNQYLIDV